MHALHVGAFTSPRIAGQPVAWVDLTGPGPFQLTVPPGRWYIHAVGGPTDAWGFVSGTVWGSHGGIYGHGTPMAVPAHGEVPPVRVHVSALWRDLTHVPYHKQPALHDDQWRAVHSVMRALGEDLGNGDLEDLGRAAGLVRTRLSALFKRATGLTMEEYRIRVRLEAAKALLVTTDAEVLQVALEVGYGGPAQLGRAFQQYLGVAPGEFRRLARAAQAGQAPQANYGPEGLSGIVQGLLPALFRRGATVRGEVLYSGSERGVVIYVCAFPRPFPDCYPAAWTALPAPGPFTLQRVPPGRHYILACFCRRRMLYPGDFYTAFAYGGYGDVDRTGYDDWQPAPVEVAEGDVVGGLGIEMVDGDRAAAYARPWYQAFLPDGR